MKELRMMIMVIFSKMNIHVLMSRNEKEMLTLEADNQMADEDESKKDCLFLDVELTGRQILRIKVFNKIGVIDSFWKRWVI